MLSVRTQILIWQRSTAGSALLFFLLLLLLVLLLALLGGHAHRAERLLNPRVAHVDTSARPGCFRKKREIDVIGIKFP